MNTSILKKLVKYRKLYAKLDSKGLHPLYKKQHHMLESKLIKMLNNDSLNIIKELQTSIADYNLLQNTEQFEEMEDQIYETSRLQETYSETYLESVLDEDFKNYLDMLSRIADNMHNVEYGQTSIVIYLIGNIESIILTNQILMGNIKAQKTLHEMTSEDKNILALNLKDFPKLYSTYFELLDLYNIYVKISAIEDNNKIQNNQNNLKLGKDYRLN